MAGLGINLTGFGSAWHNDGASHFVVDGQAAQGTLPVMMTAIFIVYVSRRTCACTDDAHVADVRHMSSTVVWPIRHHHPGIV